MAIRGNAARINFSSIVLNKLNNRSKEKNLDVRPTTFIYRVRHPTGQSLREQKSNKTYPLSRLQTSVGNERSTSCINQLKFYDRYSATTS